MPATGMATLLGSSGAEVATDPGLLRDGQPGYCDLPDAGRWGFVEWLRKVIGPTAGLRARTSRGRTGSCRHVRKAVPGIAGYRPAPTAPGRRSPGRSAPTAPRQHSVSGPGG